MLNITDLTCRVCLQEQNVLINVYDELEDVNTNLSSLLETCADLQVVICLQFKLITKQINFRYTKTMHSPNICVRIAPGSC